MGWFWNDGEEPDWAGRRAARRATIRSWPAWLHVLYLCLLLGMGVYAAMSQRWFWLAVVALAAVSVSRTRWSRSDVS